MVAAPAGAQQQATAPTIALGQTIDQVTATMGAPQQIIDHLKAIEKRYPGLERVSVSLSVGVPKALCLEQLQRFAEEVMPAFKNAKVAAPALAS